MLDEFVRPHRPRVFAGPVAGADTFVSSWSLQDRTRTFLKVQDGCDYSCTFCTIPQARGSSRSDSIANIVRQATEIGNSGVREIVLTGVNTGDFGIQNGVRIERFIDLIRRLDEVDSVARFRISSIEPNLLTDDIIRHVADSRRFMPHFHVPLQSGSDRILKLMRRRYLREVYSSRVANIKSQMPDACIGVDVIVGFPGETDSDFEETYRYLNDLDISYLHVFTYSERANTPAAEMPGIVPTAVRAERSQRLHMLSDKKRRYFYSTQEGKQRSVLFEKDIADGLMYGFTDNYVRVGVSYDPLLVNELKTVRIGACRADGTAEAEEPEAIPGRSELHLHR